MSGVFSCRGSISLQHLQSMLKGFSLTTPNGFVPQFFQTQGTTSFRRCSSHFGCLFPCLLLQHASISIFQTSVAFIFWIIDWSIVIQWICSVASHLWHPTGCFQLNGGTPTLSSILKTYFPLLSPAQKTIRNYWAAPMMMTGKPQVFHDQIIPNLCTTRLQRKLFQGRCHLFLRLFPK